MDQDREQRIRERAHAIWESEGRPEGRHEEHWHLACEAIDREESDTRRFDPTSDSMLSGTPGAGFNTRVGSFGGGEGPVRDTPDTLADAPSEMQLNDHGWGRARDQLVPVPTLPPVPERSAPPAPG